MPSGGFGHLGFGPFALGGGGPIEVVRAVAVAGQVVRVVFTEEPLHRSPAGTFDALNPSNYVLEVPAGNATAPAPMGVDVDPIFGPTYAVGNGAGASGEVGIDVHVDRQLIAGITYRITVRNVASMAGGALGSPDFGDFPGVTRLQETKLPARNQDLVDLACPPALGHYVVDDSGDLGIATPDEGTSCRVFRRLTTKKDAFRWLRDYGVGLDHKGVANLRKLADTRTDGTTQIKREPDVVDAQVQVQVQPTGLTFIQTLAKTKRGTFVSVGAKVDMLTGTTFSP